MRPLIASSTQTFAFLAALKEVAFPKPLTGTLRMTFRYRRVVGRAGLEPESAEVGRK